MYQAATHLLFYPLCVGDQPHLMATIEHAANADLQQLDQRDHTAVGFVWSVAP